MVESLAEGVSALEANALSKGDIAQAIEPIIKGLDKRPGVIYTDPSATVRVHPSGGPLTHEEREMLKSLLAACAMAAAASCVLAPEAYAGVDCQRVPPQLRAKYHCPPVVRPGYGAPPQLSRLPVVGQLFRQQRHAQRSHYVQRRYVAAESGQLKALLGKKAQAMFGPGPEGATYSGYQQVPGTSPANPCKPGYQPIANGKDPDTGRQFFRCFRPD